MSGLTYAALACYVAGFALGSTGVFQLYRQAKIARGQIAEIETASQGHSGPLSKRPALTPLVIRKTAIVLTEVLADATRWKRPAFLLVAAAVVEFAGNLLSLSW